ncbi:MAG: hypothetical protein M1821_006215 [Bathelium mastoideum]|nr:MAG: hypothetical protein M1821_006215 [Bathelium mastoideum]
MLLETVVTTLLTSGIVNALAIQSSIDHQTSAGLKYAGYTRQSTSGVAIDVNAFPNSTYDASVFALLYSIPAQYLASFFAGIIQTYGVNYINHNRNLASVADSAVIKPNVDTLYSLAVIDLSSTDLTLTVPKISDGRFWIYPFYDLYGNDIANIGIKNKSPPGSYLIRRVQDAQQPSGLQVPCPDQPPSQYVGCVNLPTTYGSFLQRLLVLRNDSQDLDALHNYQNATHLIEIPRVTQQYGYFAAPRLETLSPGPNGSFQGISTPQQLLEFAAKLIPYSPAEVVYDQYRVDTILAQAGIANGSYTPPSGIDLSEVANGTNATLAAASANPANTDDVGNTWIVSFPRQAGDFKAAYDLRAIVAEGGYLQLTQDQALYPQTLTGGGITKTGNTTLAANESLLLTFSGKPPLTTGGFWSLTLYGLDQHLVPNPVNRGAVGDRSGLRYPNGSAVYANGAQVLDNDGKGDPTGTTTPYQVLIQANTTVPPKNWTYNWLPSPPPGNGFQFVLRWYSPTEALTNGSYIYPTVERVAPIT